MSDELNGKRVAFLMANSGVEQVELTTPWQRLGAAGASTTLVASQKDTVQAFNNDVEKGDTFDADLAVADAEVGDFDALVLPGGTTNPDALRLDGDAVAFVKAFAEAGKPIAAICHGPWTLVEADVVRGKTLTSWPSLHTDLRNAGATWVDEQSFTCPTEGFTLVTSRNPDDLDAFCDAAITAFAQV
ncbi:type 1 glutamine amidotransferase domain-containing protein [Jatrophihabitans endophyticus]|uniref:type 1 glutamine amidotransferase domain-containing protein n=1 Tax=Jatrophihabitans endophyticus TaxID=1206085 RepID=UPI0019E55EA8|nr:type 1 glutamine amidotransferase domain-containing protein [Jatrophihabitans endophyticus]MBE7187057.1 type 1 glutamine amidotransferase [Jatrophihabitans endophyticus]